MVELQQCYQRTVGFPCYSYKKLRVCTVIYYCHYRQTIRVQFDQCMMPLLQQAKYIAVYLWMPNEVNSFINLPIQKILGTGYTK